MYSNVNACAVGIGRQMNCIEIEFSFDAAHRLYRYAGKCANIHGHSFFVRVTLGYDGVSSDGLSIDFARLKDTIGTWISENWDHAILLRTDDPLVKTLTAAVEILPSTVFVFKKNPTVEVLAEYLAKDVIPYHWPWLAPSVLYVSVYESVKAGAKCEVTHVPD